MTTRGFIRWLAMAVCVVALTTGMQAPVGAAPPSKACALLTASELESTLGPKVTLSGEDNPATGGVSLCMGQAPTAKVLLRLATGLSPDRDRSGSKERAGIELAKKAGAQVTVKTFGPITCSTVVPPGDLAQYGFNTTCAVSKDTAVAAVEVTAKSQKDMVSIEQLHALAVKMLDRF